MVGTRVLLFLLSIFGLIDPSRAQQSNSNDAAELPPLVVEAGKLKKVKQKKSVSTSTPQPVAPVVEEKSASEAQASDDAFQSSAVGPVDGYVATRSATGTKTNTPLIETPQSISVVTADQIEAQGAQELGPALRYTAGVSVERYGADTRGVFAQVRGFESQNDYFYQDGLKTRGSSYASFGTLDPYGAERIEVFKGPTSVLYGQNGPGGFVNYVSKRPTVESFNQVEFFAGSHDNKGAKFDFGGAVDPSGELSYRLVGVARDSGTQVDFVDADRLFLAPSLSWRPDENTSLTILTSYQRDETGLTAQYLPAIGTVFPLEGRRISPETFLGEPQDRYDIEQYSIGYLFEHKFNETWTVRQNARYSHLDMSNSNVLFFGLATDPLGNPTSETDPRYLDTGFANLDAYVVDNQVQAKVSTGAVAHTILAGVDYQLYNFLEGQGGGDADSIDVFDPVYGGTVNDYGLFAKNDITQEQVGVYVQEQAKIGRWVALLGGRYDWTSTDNEDVFNGAPAVKQKHEAFTGRAGLVYLFDNGFAPYVSYSESFNPVLGSDFFQRAFDPETGTQYEIGFKYEPRGYNALITVSAFDLARQNTRQQDPDHPGFGIQIGEVVSKGIEVETTASLADGLDVRAAYTYLDMEITETTNPGQIGNTPYAVPRHQASLWADYQFQAGVLAGWGVGAGVRYYGESFGDNDNSFEVPDVTLADAAIHYDWEKYRFALNVSNVFDTEYVASCFDPTFGCFYGETRKILATVGYRW